MKLPDDIVSGIRMARMSGKSLFEIAVEFGVDVSTASRKCSDIPRPAGVRPGGRRRVDYGLLAAMRERGITHDEIAERVGLSRVHVFRALKRHREELAA